MKLGRDCRVPLSPCASCGKIMDAATCIGDDAYPSPGDFSVCFYCGEISAYADDLMLRPLTESEIVEIAGDERLLNFQKIRPTGTVQ